MSSNAKECPGAADYQEYSMWKYDGESDLYYPVLSPKELPDEESCLTIHSSFTLPNGKEIEGYIVGVERVFSMGFFGKDNVFFINKNMPGASIEQIESLLAIQPSLEVKRAFDIFPLMYRTLIDLEGFSNVTGTFDIGETSGLTGK
ncbi:hypothetical protein K5F93_16300 [Pseudomonas protegens]|uniref:hypothetical protein n=1 Tax=Pseudomonas protegens TaxID=380021 RepID=UPI001C8DC6C0|nr:hypothetical protein [Pseudomonas protegens]QZI68008.1 hypothetical protein K5F93_16300 [Pseudomonas protegens]